MYYVVANRTQQIITKLFSQPTLAELQNVADDINEPVYVIDGWRQDALAAEPSDEFSSLRIIHIDEGGRLWVMNKKNGSRILYATAIGQPLEIVGSSIVGIPSDCPPAVKTAFFQRSTSKARRPADWPTDAEIDAICARNMLVSEIEEEKILCDDL